MVLAGVRRQLEEARALFVETERLARDGAFDPAYRAALRARNLVFHAQRGLAAARAEEPPEMPVVGVGTDGNADDLLPVLAAIDAALAVTDDLTMPPILDGLRPPLSRVL